MLAAYDGGLFSFSGDVDLPLGSLEVSGGRVTFQNAVTAVHTVNFKNVFY